LVLKKNNYFFCFGKYQKKASNSEEFEAFSIFNKKITELCKLGNPTYFVQ
jgi:hypothetical protein